MIPPKKISRIQELETIGVLATFSLLLALVSHRQWPVSLAFALLFIALFVKPLAGGITRSWLKFSVVIGTFNSKVILSLVFYLFLTPIAILYRVFNKNPLRIKNDTTASCFVDRNHTYTSADFEKMW